MSYVAGGLALNELLGGARRSKDIDLFHDAQAALAASLTKDRETLTRAGLTVQLTRQSPLESPTFVEAKISDGAESSTIQWVQDSAYRFFPLVEHPDFGLTMHPVDLATNKLLAMVGRGAPRDYIDVLHCHRTLQPLGYLAWAASGKDPGFGPLAIIEFAARTRYNQAELDAAFNPEQFEGPRPDAAALSRQWHQALWDAREIIARLPVDHVGKVVLDGLALARATPEELPERLARLSFHEGKLRGAFPEIREV